MRCKSDKKGEYQPTPDREYDSLLRLGLEECTYRAGRPPTNLDELSRWVPNLSKLIPADTYRSMSWTLTLPSEDDAPFYSATTRLMYRGRLITSTGGLILIRRGIDWECEARSIDEHGKLYIIDDLNNAAVYVSSWILRHDPNLLGPIAREDGPDTSKLDWTKYQFEVISDPDDQNFLVMRSTGTKLYFPRTDGSRQRMKVAQVDP